MSRNKQLIYTIFVTGVYLCVTPDDISHIEDENLDKLTFWKRRSFGSIDFGMDAFLALYGRIKLFAPEADIRIHETAKPLYEKALETM